VYIGLWAFVPPRPGGYLFRPLAVPAPAESLLPDILDSRPLAEPCGRAYRGGPLLFPLSVVCDNPFFFRRNGRDGSPRAPPGSGPAREKRSSPKRYRRHGVRLNPWRRPLLCPPFELRSSPLTSRPGSHFPLPETGPTPIRRPAPLDQKSRTADRCPVPPRDAPVPFGPKWRRKSFE